LKAEDGTILKEYRIFRDSQKESTQPVAAENAAMTLSVGDKLQLPTEVTVYYPSETDWTTDKLAVEWDAVAEHATDQEGTFEVLGHILGTDLTTKMQVTVLARGNQVISENASNNATDSKAFASTTNDTDAASNDRIFYINDGRFNEDGRWTNWSRTPKNQEVSVGVLFKKNGQITPRSVGKIAIQFFKDSGTDAPATMVLERYVGPTYSEPSTISRYEENADHPFNKAENWQEIPYKASGAIEAGKPIEFTFDPIQTTAIRARMTRKSTTNGLAMVEFSAYSPAKASDSETPAVTISINGKALENFDPAVSEYRLTANGAKPEVTVQTSGHGVATVVESNQGKLPTLVRLLAKDGSLVKEYRLHFEASSEASHAVDDQALVLDRPSLEVEKVVIPFKEIILENSDLAKDERRIVSEGQNGEKVNYVEVLGTSRKVVHTEIIEAKDQIVEVGVKAIVTSSKGDVPAPVLEVPEYTDPIGTVGEEPAPVVDVPEYTDPIGTVGEEPAPVVDVPEYTGAVGTVGEEPAPVVDLPEYTGAIGTVGDEPAPVVDVPEYTGAIGTVGDEPAPIVEVPEYSNSIGTAGDQEAPIVEVPEFKGGANWVEAAKNEVPEFKGGANWVEAAKNEVPEFKGGVNAVQADKNELPEYTGTLGTAGDQAAPTIDKPVADIRGLSDKPSETQASAEQTQGSQVLGNASEKADSARLPETGESQSDTAIFLAGLSLALSAAFLNGKRKEE